jgi:hypothetical protein
MNIKNSLAAIEELVEDYNFVKSNLLAVEASVAQNLQRHLTKMLILSCASYYESKITNTIVAYAQENSRKYMESPHGFDMLERQSFFRMFEFGRDKLNSIRSFLSPLSFLGTRFKEALIIEVSNNEEKERNMFAFQEMCSMRNSLAHNDLITYSDASSKSFEDIKALHDKAIKFLSLLEQKLE